MACPCTLPSADKLLHAIQHDRSEKEAESKKALFSKQIATLYGHCCGTFLHLAVRYDNREIARHLIELGSNVNRYSPTGKTPLAMAVELKHKDLVNLLLESNASMHIVNDNGLSALQMALYMRPIDYEISNVFIRNSNPESYAAQLLVDIFHHAGITLQRVVPTKNIKLVEAMLQYGYAVQPRDRNGKTALYVAAQENDLDIAKLLLKNNANVNLLHHSGKGPLFYAAWHRNLSMIKILLERDANPNARNRYNEYTPLFALYASKRTDNRSDLAECAKILVQYGAIPQNSSYSNKTILEWAWKHEKMGIDYLIAQIAFLDMTSSKKLHVSYNNVSDPEILESLEKSYLNCQKTLKILIFEKMSVLNLLANSEYKWRCRIRNERFGPKLKKACLEKNLEELHPYYYDTLMKRMEKAQRTVKLEDEAMLVICELLKRDYNECYSTVRNVVSYLSEYDLKQVCNVQLEDNLLQTDEYKTTLKAMKKLNLCGFRVNPY